MMDYKAVGEAIKELRKKLGLTQKELAEKIGRTESSVAKYERGLVEIPNSVLQDIAKQLQIDLSVLLRSLDNRRPAPFLSALDLLDSIGYHVSVYEEDEHRSVSLRNNETYDMSLITDEQLHELSDSIVKYARFLAQGIIDENKK